MKLVHAVFTAVHAVIALLFALAALSLLWIAAAKAWGVWAGGLQGNATLHLVEALGVLASGVVALQIAQTVTEEEVVREAHISGPTRHGCGGFCPGFWWCWWWRWPLRGWWPRSKRRKSRPACCIPRP